MLGDRGRRGLYQNKTRYLLSAVWDGPDRAVTAQLWRERVRTEPCLLEEQTPRVTLNPAIWSN